MKSYWRVDIAERGPGKARPASGWTFTRMAGVSSMVVCPPARGQKKENGGLRSMGIVPGGSGLHETLRKLKVGGDAVVACADQTASCNRDHWKA